MRTLIGLLLVFGTASADPKADVAAAVAKQIKALASDEKLPPAASSTGHITVLGSDHDDTKTADKLGEILSHRLDAQITAKQVKVLSLSRDGQTAIVTFQSPNERHDPAGGVTPRNFRVSEMVIKPQKDWEVLSGIWSEGVKDAAVNKRAKAGKQTEFNLLAAKDLGDPSLLEAMDTFLTTGFDLEHVHPNLVGIGSAPNEVISGKAFATAFNKNWAGKLTVVGGKVTQKFGEDNATTGWGVAHVKLAKGTGKGAYAIQFRIYVVFEQDPYGSWLPWHVHVATNDN